jgi:Tol biopolymer transport system component
MDADGSNGMQLTHELGYDDGLFWSYDGTKIVYHAQHPKNAEEEKNYKELLAQGLIRPGNLEIWVMNADGSDKHQVPHNGEANFGPYWLPDGKRIIFGSNQADPKNGRDFNFICDKRRRHGAGAHHVSS